MSRAAMRIVVLQLNVVKDKATNVLNAISKIEASVKEHKPRLITLPECIYLPQRKSAENIPNGSTSQLLSKAAMENQVYIVGGTILEWDENGSLYNTCTVWGPNGDLIGKHRKMHLFDVDIKGGIRFKESDTISSGNSLTTVTVDGHKIGIGVCYDARFEEMARLYRNDGCEMLIYPTAFHMTTGPLYSEVLTRARALDNQLFVISNSSATDYNAEFVVYGHSMIIDPWGRILKSAGYEEAQLVADIDFSLVEKVRQEIPIFKHRRLDVYSTQHTN